jgi:signal transduction histidine kinase
MDERARQLGGRTEVQSAPGQGTEVRATFPLGVPVILHAAGRGARAA